MLKSASHMSPFTYHDDYQQLLAVLKALRREVGMTQVELGLRLGNTQTFVSKIERGERRLDVSEFVDVCEALGVKPLQAFEQYLTARQKK